MSRLPAPLSSAWFLLLPGSALCLGALDSHSDRPRIDPQHIAWYAGSDDTVNLENAEMLANKLKERNVPYRLRAVPTGGHGIALGNGTQTQGWLTGPSSSGNRTRTVKVP